MKQSFTSNLMRPREHVSLAKREDAAADSDAKAEAPSSDATTTTTGEKSETKTSATPAAIPAFGNPMDQKRPVLTANTTGNAAIATITSSLANPSETANSILGGAIRTGTNTTAGTTTVGPTDPVLTYSCPGGGTWSKGQVLSGQLTGSFAVGAGCNLAFTFTGDSISIYGAASSKSGVFGCSVTTSNWNSLGWWNAYSASNQFKSYVTMCAIKGLGYEQHTIYLTNNPNSDTSGLWFTGLMYTTNISAETFAVPTWQAIGPSYTFGKGATTTIPANGISNATVTSNTTFQVTTAPTGGFKGISQTNLLIVLAVAVVVLAVTGIIIGMCCCHKRENKHSAFNDIAASEPTTVSRRAEDSLAKRRLLAAKKTRSRFRNERIRERESSSEESSQDERFA